MINAILADENVTYANGKLTLTDAFKNNAQKHGNQTLVVTVEKGGTYYAVSVKILVITKEITTIDELTAALTPTANDAVYGYYRLKTDLSYSGWYTVGYAKSWTAPQRSNKNLGFRGTFDGNGKKITSWFYQDGLFGVVGSGAVIKNLTIDVKQYGNNGNLNLTLGYSMMEATLDTVTINVLSGGATSIPTNAAFGLLTCLGAYGNTLKNVNINADGLGIDTLFGTGCWFTYPTDYAANTFENCTITAQSLIGLACTDNANKTVIPYTGVSGLTVNIPA
ncbi:s-layer domain-containing protein [Acidiphilium sp. CAG:727]|nr:s-layer domain-containing protein [Acidiphilium sp. CAG:727]